MFIWFIFAAFASEKVLKSQFMITVSNRITSLCFRLVAGGHRRRSSALNTSPSDPVLHFWRAIGLEHLCVKTSQNILTELTSQSTRSQLCVSFRSFHARTVQSLSENKHIEVLPKVTRSRSCSPVCVQKTEKLKHKEARAAEETLSLHALQSAALRTGGPPRTRTVPHANRK